MAKSRNYTLDDDFTFVNVNSIEAEPHKKEEKKNPEHPVKNKTEENKEKQVISPSIEKKSTKIESKRKPGRPKTKEGAQKKINLILTESMFNQITRIKPLYKDNMTYYIEKLVEKDLEENGKKYDLLLSQLSEL